MFDLYHILKSLHLIALIAWMCGMLYLPRLFVYHADAVVGGEASQMLKVMERRLLKFIMNPAMIATWVIGIWLAISINAFDPQNGAWMHAKLGLVLLMSGLHGFMATINKDFAADRNYRSAKFYRILNEVPTVLLIIIVLLVVVKPF